MLSAFAKVGAPDWVETALNNPLLVQPDADDAELEHRLAVITNNGHRVLRVVVKRNTQPALVITAYFDRKMKGKL